MRWWVFSKFYNLAAVEYSAVLLIFMRSGVKLAVMALESFLQGYSYIVQSLNKNYKNFGMIYFK